ncbi:MAG TPA: orotidine-5'-phosphate decarboxylase [Acidimicrobiia bacterium]|nr:orotidine-5'-phosphate decarboxylase [Acidimicrobiia bacterium]
MAEIPVAVALDLSSGEEAVRLARSLSPHVGAFKIGLELLSGPGPVLVSALAELGKPVFCDAKLHDIPNTVGRAAANLARAGARWITVHAAGGPAMLDAAAEGAAKGSPDTGILAITVLTSLTASDLARVGLGDSVGRQVSRMARLAGEHGAEGAVCSVRELGDVAQAAPDLFRVTPGIRPAGSDHGDQARTATPHEALKRGADLLVVGRPITAAPDPVAAAAAIAASIVESRRADR